MIRRALAALGLMTLLLPAVALALQSTPIFQCLFASGHGSRTAPTEYLLDLQCQPALPETIEIPSGGSIRVTVNLNNYYTATGRSEATFVIHLAMDRARLVLRPEGAERGSDVSDLLAALRDVPVTSTADVYRFTIENHGFRSAVFDLSVRPR